MLCSIILPLSSEYCEEVFYCLEFSLVKIKVGPSKHMWLYDKEIHKKLWKEEFSANSESEFSDDSDMIVKFCLVANKVTALMLKLM
jgi:hypothetical protein